MGNRIAVQSMQLGDDSEIRAGYDTVSDSRCPEERVVTRSEPTSHNWSSPKFPALPSVAQRRPCVEVHSLPGVSQKQTNDRTNILPRTDNQVDELLSL